MLNCFTLRELLAEENVDMLKSLIDEECKRTAVKQAGGSTLLSRRQAAIKYLKGITYPKGLMPDYKETIEGKEYQCFCNGFSGVILNDSSNIPEIDLKLSEREIKDIRERGAFCLGSIMLPSKIDSMEEIEIDVSAIIEREKSKEGGKTIIKDIDIGNRNINAKVILPVIKILGGNIKAYQEDENENHAIFLKSENGYAIVLPLRK